MNPTGRYPATVYLGAPDMIPPEHHDTNLADVTRTVESDLFSIAILLFKCQIGRAHV